MNTLVKFKKVIFYLLYIILIPIILYDLYLIIQNNLHPDTTPELFGIKTFNIISGSMEPGIKIDDIIFVKTVKQYEIQKKDIITFVIDNETITHRVINVEIKDNKFIYTTKGDKNEVSDIEKIEFDQIEGKYIGRIPKMGILVNLLKNKIVFFVILIVLILCYYLQRKSIHRKIKRKEKRIRFDNRIKEF